MSFIKYITVLDDERNKVMKYRTLEKYDIATYPSFYFADGVPQYDSVNTDYEIYCRQKASGVELTEVKVPCKVFLNAFSRAYDNGYLVVFVFCPHGKFYPDYKEAKKAADMFMRRNEVKESGFVIRVFNTKTFAAGHSIATLKAADEVANLHCPSNVVAYYAKEKFEKSTTFIFNRDEKTGEFYAKKIYGTRVFDINITNSIDEVKYEKFAFYVAKNIYLSQKEYAISIGGDCRFAGNIIGRIETYLDELPVTVMQYGLPTVAFLGPGALCIHLL